MKTPLAYSIVPIAPSHTSTRWSSASKNGLLINLVVLQRINIDEQIRPIDPVDAHGTYAFPHGLDEPVMMTAKVQPRLHRCKDIVDGGLPRVATQRSLSGLRLVNADERTRRLMRHEDVDAAHLPAGINLFADEVAALVVCQLVVRQLRGRRLNPCGRI